MKYVVLQVAVLTAVVGLAVALGQPVVAGRWGGPGIAALHAAATIALGAAVLAAVPLGLVATYRPKYAPQTAFAGTAIRLLGTAGLGLAYQLLARPHQTPFLVALLAVYLLLLVAETVLIVCIVRRVFHARPAEME